MLGCLCAGRSWLIRRVSRRSSWRRFHIRKWSESNYVQFSMKCIFLSYQRTVTAEFAVIPFLERVNNNEVLCISLQNTRWPHQDPSFTLSQKLPAVSALSLFGWREICALGGQVSPRLNLCLAVIHLSRDCSQISSLFLYVRVSSSRTDLVPPLPVTRTADVPGSSSTPAQVKKKIYLMNLEFISWMIDKNWGFVKLSVIY